MPGHLVRRLHQISVSLFMERVSPANCDITPVQFAALSAIAANPGIDQASLAGMIAYDRVTIGGVVDRLVHKGLADRKPSKTDRRAKAVFMTAAGNAMLGNMTEQVRAMQQELLAPLDRHERATFVAMLSRLAEAGNAHSRAPLKPARRTEVRDE